LYSDAAFFFLAAFLPVFFEDFLEAFFAGFLLFLGIGAASLSN